MRALRTYSERSLANTRERSSNKLFFKHAQFFVASSVCQLSSARAERLKRETKRAASVSRNLMNARNALA